MTDREKAIRMLNNTLRHCHNLYNHVTNEEQTWLAEINQGAKDALALLKEQSDVVLCKDCKFYTDPQICPVFGMDRYDDWFCAGGKRR